MIELEHVSKSYGRKLAVDDLHLTVPQGELFAFLGPNGAGKTTTIRMLVGLLRPSSGRVRLCGHDVTANARAAAQLLGYVPDEPYLYDKLTGREFLQFIVDMYGISGSEGTRFIAQQIDHFELSAFVDELTETYSHGMKQRLVFAAAMLHQPQVLIIDEPMVGLDPRSARLVKDLLRERASAGTTIFMSTHTLAVAEEIADRIGIVDHGRLRCLGTLDELQRELSLHGSSLERMFLEVTGASNAAPAPAETVPE
ncbi:MAG: ABC transporter ATP-binding protein [Pirellulales bacterium]|nr:ABC transporter ATP-binding protein [Pirellulales bacterium]